MSEILHSVINPFCSPRTLTTPRRQDDRDTRFVDRGRGNDAVDAESDFEPFDDATNYYGEHDCADAFDDEGLSARYCADAFDDEGLSARYFDRE